jgi:hypothetical protein
LLTCETGGENPVEHKVDDGDVADGEEGFRNDAGALIERV